MSSGDDLQFVIFRVGPQEFALDIFQVERILRYERPAALPKAPAFLEGVVPYGGGVVPVVDLRKRLDLPAELREETRLMVLDLDDQRVGILVDEVRRGPASGQRTTIAAPPPDGPRPRRDLHLRDHHPAGAHDRHSQRREAASLQGAVGPGRGGILMDVPNDRSGRHRAARPVPGDHRPPGRGRHARRARGVQAARSSPTSSGSMPRSPS